MSPARVSNCTTPPRDFSTDVLLNMPVRRWALLPTLLLVLVICHPAASSSCKGDACAIVGVQGQHHHKEGWLQKTLYKKSTKKRHGDNGEEKEENHNKEKGKKNKRESHHHDHKGAACGVPEPFPSKHFPMVAQPAPPNGCPAHVNVVKIIWMFWHSYPDLGPGSYGDFRRRCVDAWRTLNPGWELRVINMAQALEMAPKFAASFDLPEHKKYCIQLQADLFRMEVLYKWGGVWADTTTLPVRPLDTWIYDAVVPSGFWAYTGGSMKNVSQQPKHQGRQTCFDVKMDKERVIKCNSWKYLNYKAYNVALNWFIATSAPGNLVIRAWRDIYFENLQLIDSRSKNPRCQSPPYFLQACSFLVMQQSIPEVAKLIAKTPSDPQHDLRPISLERGKRDVNGAMKMYKRSAISKEIHDAFVAKENKPPFFLTKQIRHYLVGPMKRWSSSRPGSVARVPVLLLPSSDPTVKFDIKMASPCSATIETQKTLRGRAPGEATLLEVFRGEKLRYEYWRDQVVGEGRSSKDPKFAIREWKVQFAKQHGRQPTRKDYTEEISGLVAATKRETARENAAAALPLKTGLEVLDGLTDDGPEPQFPTTPSRKFGGKLFLETTQSSALIDPDRVALKMFGCGDDPTRDPTRQDVHPKACGTTNTGGVPTLFAWPDSAGSANTVEVAVRDHECALQCKMHKVPGGFVTVLNLEPEQYAYKFLVDGRWRFAYSQPFFAHYGGGNPTDPKPKRNSWPRYPQTTANFLSIAPRQGIGEMEGRKVFAMPPEPKEPSRDYHFGWGKKRKSPIPVSKEFDNNPEADF